MHYYPQYNFEEHYTYAPTKLMCSSLQVKRWKRGYWHYIYTPETDVLKSPHQEVGGIDITHNPPTKLMCLSPCQEVGGIDIAHTQTHKKLKTQTQKHYSYSNWCAKVSKSWDGGIDITHTTPNWCAQVSKSRGGGWYWHYTYLPNWCAQVSQVKRCGILILHKPPN